MMLHISRSILKRLNRADDEFEAFLRYTETLCLKNNNEKQIQAQDYSKGPEDSVVKSPGHSSRRSGFESQQLVVTDNHL